MQHNIYSAVHTNLKHASLSTQSSVNYSMLLSLYCFGTKLIQLSLSHYFLIMTVLIMQDSSV